MENKIFNEKNIRFNFERSAKCGLEEALTKDNQAKRPKTNRFKSLSS